MNLPAQTAGNAGPSGFPTLLEVRDILLARDGRPLLRIDHLDLYSGQVVALIGPSGCGKSTFLSYLSGAFSAQAGHLAFPSHDGPPPRTYISRSVQGAPLLHWRTVRQNLELAAKIKGVALDDPDAVLARFAAEQLAERFPSSLSGGERCRASLCQVLVGDPQILLLDEPFTGLDVAVKRFVANNIFSLARESGAGVIMVTHDIVDAIEHSDRVVVLGGTLPATIIGELEGAINSMPRITELLSQ